MILPCEPLTGLPSASPSQADEASIDIWWWPHGGNVDWREGRFALSEDERKRAEAFRFDRDAAAFAAGRHLQRCALSTYMRTPPVDLMFTTGKRGKPALVVPYGQQQIAFNLSNTQELAVVAVSRDCETVGIDAEPTTARIEPQAASFFCSTDEKATLSRLEGDEHQQLLLSYWVLKESFLKANGTGLVEELHQINVRVDPQRPVIRVGNGLDDAASWHHRLLTAPGHLVAVSAKSNRANLRFLQFETQAPDARQ